MSGRTWKQELGDRIPEDLGREIDIFETEIGLRSQNKLDEVLFAETRLRRGVYGQRYDNGQRFDGSQTQQLAFPDALTKGPNTAWHAPGMQRIKIPFGGLTAEQMDVLADLGEEVSDNILHVTTRQDIQLHYVHIEDTPDMMRRLAAVDITTREACGNSVRNVTACPLAGVCNTESFDVTPYSRALARFLLGHEDMQDFGRKFKIAFSGCRHEACGLTNMHDLGALGVTRIVDGVEKRGFEVWVGGGLGAVPHQAKLFDEFVAEEELLPLAQAMGRVFARLGEKRNRARARVKFLIAKLGIEEFKRLVLEERQQLPHDERWTSYLAHLDETDEEPLKPGQALNGADLPEGFEQWHQTNVYQQRQSGHVVVTVALPLGDMTSDQMRNLATIARRYVKDTVRLTVEQNIVLRWISESDLPALYSELKAIGLGGDAAGTIVDITACPGTDTCKLGISSSRGLAGELRRRLAERYHTLDAAVQDLRIKISGCFNSCGQHHAADIGFYGISRKINGITVPHFQVILGGQWKNNAGSFGLPMAAVPSKNIPAVVERLTERFITERQQAESFQDYFGRIGKREVKAILDDLAQVPTYEEDPSFYRDWGDVREYTTADMGKGECAGEVVPLAQFELTTAEREAFEAQILLDEGDPSAAYQTACGAMVQAARALVRTEFLDVGDDADRIIGEFRTRFFDTELFFDPFAKDKFARYLFRNHEEPLTNPSAEDAHRAIEEAQLFIDSSFSCYNRISDAEGTPAA
ncbi:MAG: nitrite/sulfite reductase [Gemmatimonadetes bacterium]|jgi:sulfite reductase (ferredoxin)|nr:nitrite/sulfite reductase [Gemmatimonadota bacterium]MBT5055708.1 nitrite/sulfite reductase [Gemmatimonadota bacterium]MBT5143871.1 nitrite/sulfite reductase [Gemmatimonadota bacterium]MBT5589051.1 nitrite/sulfite reductase [Gemmatimonadota bacterium]MBT5962965.1 nitrite/sulfite reductase [Gemmatimonadota bacterium]